MQQWLLYFFISISTVHMSFVAIISVRTFVPFSPLLCPCGNGYCSCSDSAGHTLLVAMVIVHMKRYSFLSNLHVAVLIVLLFVYVFPVP
jgi:hypothetical protein